MAKVSPTFVKCLTVLILLLISISAVMSACIKNGGRCLETAGPPYCCSNYCYRQVGQSYGVCKKH